MLIASKQGTTNDDLILEACRQLIRERPAVQKGSALGKASAARLAQSVRSYESETRFHLHIGGEVIFYRRK